MLNAGLITANKRFLSRKQQQNKPAILLGVMGPNAESLDDVSGGSRKEATDRMTLKQNWGTIRKLTHNKQEWKTFAAVLHAGRHV